MPKAHFRMGDLVAQDNWATKNLPFLRQGRDAKQFSKELPKDYGSSDEGMRDAARHMYLMAELSRDYGKPVAIGAGYLHEFITKLLGGGLLNDTAEMQASRRMDFHNNRIGAALGLLSDSPEATKELVLDAVVRGAYDPSATAQTEQPIYRRQPPEQFPLTQKR